MRRTREPSAGQPADDSSRAMICSTRSRTPPGPHARSRASDPASPSSSCAAASQTAARRAAGGQVLPDHPHHQPVRADAGAIEAEGQQRRPGQPRQRPVHHLCAQPSQRPVPARQPCPARPRRPATCGTPAADSTASRSITAPQPRCRHRPGQHPATAAPPPPPPAGTAPLPPGPAARATGRRRSRST